MWLKIWLKMWHKMVSCAVLAGRNAVKIQGNTIRPLWIRRNDGI